MKTKKVLITGFSGSGKSTLLSMIKTLASIDEASAFVDLDEQIELQQVESIASIIQTVKIDAFRKIENQMLLKLMMDPKIKVIALGGGALLEAPASWKSQEDIQVIWLNVSFDTCWRRIESQGLALRPLSQMGASALQMIYEERFPQYESWAKKEVKEPSLNDMKELALYILNLLR